MATAATEELAALLQRQAELEAKADQITAEERAAAVAAREASDQLVALERQAATGAKVRHISAGGGRSVDVKARSHRYQGLTEASD